MLPLRVKLTQLWATKLNRSILIGVGLGLIAVITALVFYQSARGEASSANLQTTPAPAAQVLAATVDLGDPPEELKQLNILLLGYGGAGHSGGYLTDVIQVVHIDFVRAQIALISIPRDLWVELPNGTSAKINSAFTLGSDPNNKIAGGGAVAKQMASVVTGLPIHYVISTDFVSFKRIIGYALDGITVNVPETLDDPWYPITGEELNTCGLSAEEVASLTAQYSGFELEKQFPCRYEHVHFDPGVTAMEGDDALKYVRSRHGSGAGDFSRSQRQHALLKGIKDKVLSLQAAQDIPRFFSTLAEHTASDINLEIAQYLAPALQLASGFEIKSVVLSTENVLTSGKSASGQYIILPQAGLGNWNQVHGYLKSQLEN